MTMGQIMYPPELLSVDKDADVLVCLGPPQCDGGQAPCPLCMKINVEDEPLN